MRKLKIAVAILVVLFACQAAFAAFVPVQKADPAVTDKLARYCDILLLLSETQDDPVGFFKEIAAGPEDGLEMILLLYSMPTLGYESVTTTEDLAKVFPRGVEATDDISAFRRAAIHLAAYTARNGRLEDNSKIDEGKASFEIVGYKYLVTYEDGKMKFDFIDIFSELELGVYGGMLALCVPFAELDSITYPEYGEIDIAAPEITRFGFDYFVAYARSLMYTTIYF